MEGNQDSAQDASAGWEEIGRAAEDFARRVARDAAKFAERLEEHAGEFARDVSRDWRRAQRHASRRGCGTGATADVRTVFEDIRGVLSDVLDGVDELIARVFPTATESEWVRIVANRDTTCGACGGAIATGADVYACRRAAGMEFRCMTCGTPTSNPSS